MEKRLRAVVLLVVFAILVLISRNIEAEGSEAVLTSGTVTQLEGAATAYEQKDISSKVIAEFSEGDSVFVTDVEDSWAEIFYKGETGYIPVDQIGHENIAAAEKSAEEIGQAIDEELKKNDIETSVGIDNYLRKKNQELNALIWKIVIGALVVVIIVVSVIIGRMNKTVRTEESKEVIKEENPDDKPEKDEEIVDDSDVDNEDSDSENDNENDETEVPEVTANEIDDVTYDEKESENEADYSDSVL